MEINEEPCFEAPIFLKSALLQEEVASAWAPLGLQVEKEMVGVTLFWR